ncbi:hypothetical protein [Desulfobaculum senezii]
MKKTLVLIACAVALSALCLGGCGYKEGTVSPDPKAYLWFTGETEGVQAYIDGQGPVELGPHYYTDSMGNKRAKSSEVHYEIDPGKHTIRLVRDGQTILERVLLLGNHTTREIEVP